MLLSVDTSTNNLGVALYDDTQVFGEITWLSRNHHTIELAPTVERLLTHTELGIERLEAVAVALGPGSFTGLRIGLAFCKGLALSRRIPIIGIPTLDVVAYGQPIMDINLTAMLQAGRSRLAVALYRVEAGSWTQIGNLENLTHEEFVEWIEPPVIICGEMTSSLASLITERHEDVILASPALSLRRPSFLAELAWQRWKDGKDDDATTLKPIYMHHGKPIPEGKNFKVGTEF